MRVPEIGLFPLELVLLPTERVPLHIFEDRYKELIGECLEGEGEFGLVLADERGLREIGTREQALRSTEEGERPSPSTSTRKRSSSSPPPFAPHRPSPGVAHTKICRNPCTRIFYAAPSLYPKADRLKQQRR